MKRSVLFMFAAAIVAGCAERNPEAEVDHSDQIAVFKKRIADTLPEGWSITASRQDHVTGREGIYIFAENPSIKLERPKVVQHAHVDLYFRPKDATSTCGQIQIDGSIYSSFLGGTPGYRVYGGSVGANLNDEIRVALELKETQNNEIHGTH